MHRLLPAALLVSIASAQTIDLPAAARLWPGRWGQPQLFYHPETSGRRNEARSQLLYALAEVPQPWPVVRGLAFRTWEAPIPNFAGTIQLDVRMSTSPRDPDRGDPVFAANEGPAPQQVFTGTVSLPATSGGTWPQPWAVSFALQAPFAVAPAAGDRALVVDVRCWNNTAGRAWIAELYDRDVGRARTEHMQVACIGPTGMAQMAWSVSSAELVAGGLLWLWLGMYPPNHPSLHVNALCFGLEGVGGTWLGRRLPVPLATLGVPSPPACEWATAVLASTPMIYYPEGDLDTGTGLPIPPEPDLIGVRLVAQNAALARYTDGLRVFPSTAIALTIRSGQYPAGSCVVAEGDRNAATGSPFIRLPVPVQLR